MVKIKMKSPTKKIKKKNLIFSPSLLLSFALPLHTNILLLSQSLPLTKDNKEKQQGSLFHKYNKEMKIRRQSQRDTRGIFRRAVGFFLFVLEKEKERKEGGKGYILKLLKRKKVNES